MWFRYLWSDLTVFFLLCILKYMLCKTLSVYLLSLLQYKPGVFLSFPFLSPSQHKSPVTAMALSKKKVTDETRFQSSKLPHSHTVTSHFSLVSPPCVSKDGFITSCHGYLTSVRAIMKRCSHTNAPCIIKTVWHEGKKRKRNRSSHTHMKIIKSKHPHISLFSTPRANTHLRGHWHWYSLSWICDSQSGDESAFFSGDCQSVRVAGEWTWCPFVFLFSLSHIVSAFPPPSLFSPPSLFQSFTHPLSSSSGCLWAPRRVCLSWPFTSVSCTVRPVLSAAWPGTPTAPGTDMLAAPICRPCAGREDIPALSSSRQHW